MSGRVTTRYASSTRYSFPYNLIVQFFLNFCQAAFVFTAFVFATLVVYTVRMMNGSSSDLDPQMIVIIALYVWKTTHSLVLDGTLIPSTELVCLRYSRVRWW